MNDRPEYAAGIESLTNDLLPKRSQPLLHTVPRDPGNKRIAGTLFVGFVVFALASASWTLAVGTKESQASSRSAPSDIGIAEEFQITADRTVPLPSGPTETPIPDQSTSRVDDHVRVTPVATQAPPTEEPTIGASPPRVDVLPPDVSDLPLSLFQEEARLLQLPAASLRFNGEPLSLAVAMIADAAGMSYASNGVLEGNVTGSLVGNPFRLLKNLSKVYQFEMDYHQGLWTFVGKEPVPAIISTTPPSIAQKGPSERRAPLITRSYRISNNMLERLEINQSGGFSSRSSSAGGSNGGFGGDGIASSGNLLAGRTVFEANYDRMIDDLNVLLRGNLGPNESTGSAVFLNEDGNTLMAVATADQHRLIEAYLNNFDKKQRAIALEVKLVRTKRNPSSLVGVDWSQGVKFDLSGTFDEGKVSLDQLVGGLGGNPTGVLLSNSQASITLDAIKNDSLTKRISYIEKMTLDNREVVLSNVIEEPVIGDREEVDSESGLRVLLTIDKEIIGTVINILPRILPDDKVKMRLRLEDSNIVRFKQFFEGSSGGEYPVISKQTYEGPVVIQDGYSLAITGFETTEEVQSSSRVPVLGRLPLVGKAFGRDSTQEERSYLVIFITPRILNDASSGVDYTMRGHHLGREEPVGSIQTARFETFDALDRYVSGIRRQHDALMQEVDLKGVTSATAAEADFVYRELVALAEHLQQFQTSGIQTDRASKMLDFCESGIANTWQICQQSPPQLSATPITAFKDDVHQRSTAFHAAKRASTRKSQRRPWSARRKGR